jgi:hypothetical protein
VNAPCEAQVDGVCTGRAVHAHHKVLRSQGGTDDPRNLLLVCTACHGWIHAHPGPARGLGFIQVPEACAVCGRRLTPVEWLDRVVRDGAVFHPNCLEAP